MKKAKILIVDDVPSNIHMLSGMLKDDFSVIGVKDGQKAIEIANKENKPDIILLDIMMPQMSGYEVCKILKQNEYTKDIPVLFVSSLNDISEQEEGLEAGGDDFISKPISKKILLSKINMHLKLNDLKSRKVQKDQKMELNDFEKVEKTPKILIVDDAPENIQMAIEILKNSYGVIVATSGEKALEIAFEDKGIDLILLDIVMPNMDGFEVCKRLKENETTKDIPVIFLTILENESDMVKGLEIGAVDYVTKPFEPKVLKARVSTHVKLKKYQDELKKTIKEKDEILIKQSKLATAGEMFESVMHQWKQPLSVITASNANIRIEEEFETLSREKLFKLLDEVDSSAQHLNETMDLFRDFLYDDVKKQYFDFEKVLDKTIELLASKLKNRNIKIEKEVEKTELFTFKNDLIQVLVNILSNAIYALTLKQGGEKTISIKSYKQEDKFIINICDNGEGISQENLDRIFVKYFTTKDEKNGSGIGLFICKMIVEKNLQGKIRVYNHQNGGACFEIEI